MKIIKMQDPKAKQNPVTAIMQYRVDKLVSD